MKCKRGLIDQGKTNPLFYVRQHTAKTHTPLHLFMHPKYAAASETSRERNIKEIKVDTTDFSPELNPHHCICSCVQNTLRLVNKLMKTKAKQK